MGLGDPPPPEGTELATVFDRAVLVSIELAVYLGPFLANLPRHDN